jgi:hypothetical protein
VNEFGGMSFSHTSPVDLQLAGQGVFDREVARGLLAEVQADRSEIEKRAEFASVQQLQHVRAVYDEANAKLHRRLDKYGE